MTIRVLIVDDSSFICNRIQETLEQEQDFKVVGIAKNGLQALAMTVQLKPDVITMDVEMPVMDGITAVKKIMAISPTPILMFSALTLAGAQATFDALDAGAIDFLPKQLDEIDENRETAKSLLRRRLRMVALQTNRVYKHDLARQQVAVKKAVIQKKSATRTREVVSQCDLLTIVASTGGPVAIQKVLAQISQSCSIPILLIQHMPGSFTKSFAVRLDQVCSIQVREASDGDQLEPGVALLAPGGVQMELNNKEGRYMIKLRDKAQDEIYSPCADITLTSIAENFTDKTLTVVLTGMGSDGKEGAKKLKQKGANIWAQDEASCIIYGMPKAIINAELADEIYSLDEMAHEIGRLN